MVTLQDLRRYPYFATISEENLKQVAAVTTQKNVPANTQMFCEGDDADTLYVIVRGEVKIDYHLETGELKTVDILGAGDLLVWSAIVEPHKMTGDGTTNKDTQLLAIDAKKLYDFFDIDPQLGYLMMTQVAKLLANRLKNARGLLAKAG